jgi:hypothetical protein
MRTCASAATSVTWLALLTARLRSAPQAFSCTCASPWCRSIARMMQTCAPAATWLASLPRAAPVHRGPAPCTALTLSTRAAQAAGSGGSAAPAAPRARRAAAVSNRAGAVRAIGLCDTSIGLLCRHNSSGPGEQQQEGRRARRVPEKRTRRRAGVAVWRVEIGHVHPDPVRDRPRASRSRETHFVDTTKPAEQQQGGPARRGPLEAHRTAHRNRGLAC